ncbi:peptidoglycan/LPS O-acetylase OafA/YrhL [Rhodoferax ferrireducens]|uniref:Peptidoglycan/LPS O-acetylase OafA/YrhL n=1 Tax=Rhodoferax ferrireducens TaxID=192843 RepID=A0ABU2C6U8_9BURK|nr:acyltransferase [Rhodoferax ferrireducens]MDR7377060.1 peptidoglycan/LPS O-acetylase OafA/YrhL [Rhodoferax ferrireducens]
MKTFGSVLEANKGIGPGFDFARLFLAFAVLAWHSLLVLPGGYTSAIFDSPMWLANYAILPMFFGLSGFLVAGSAERLSLKNFALNRGLRIFPALIVEILLSAFVLGVIFTTLPLKEYFTNWLFYKYFLNIVGKINYLLPGVFEANPYPGIVNGSLWTVPFEILCYLVLGALMYTKLFKNAWVVLAVAIVSVFIGITIDQLHELIPNSVVMQSVWRVYNGSRKGALLLPCFLLGVLAFRCRNRIPFNWPTLLLSAAAMLALAFLGSEKMSPIILAFCAPIMVYIVCYVGLLKIPKIPYYHTGDYSYGIYLYAFPIQQALVLLFPGLTSLVLHLLFSIVLVTIFASFSWHVIEKPILGLRKKFSFTAKLHGVGVDKDESKLKPASKSVRA